MSYNSSLHPSSAQTEIHEVNANLRMIYFLCATMVQNRVFKVNINLFIEKVAILLRKKEFKNRLAEEQ